jgi:plastocyanin
VEAIMTKSTRRQVLRRTAVVGGIALAGCSSDEGTEAPPDDDGSSGETSWEQTSTVEMTDELTFVPKRIKVSAGTTVTWKNVGSIGHTVTAYQEEIPDGATYFASGGYESEQAAKDAYSSDNGGNVPEGETYEHTFETKGTYKYYCIPHELSGMVGFVKVN